MTIFFLPRIKGMNRNLKVPIFYTNHDLVCETILIPYGYALVRCEYTGDYTEEGHRWKNPYHPKEYKNHPLGLKDGDNNFYEDFYEITKIKALLSCPARKTWLFREGEVWSIETNTKSFPIVKTDPNSVWNFLEQRYDQPCNNNGWSCDISPRVSYSALVSDIRFLGNSLHEIFAEDMTLFFQVYCKCCTCERCRTIHDYSCTMTYPATSTSVDLETLGTNMQEVD
jgi:hypothetical protein